MFYGGKPRRLTSGPAIIHLRNFCRVFRQVYRSSIILYDCIVLLVGLVDCNWRENSLQDLCTTKCPSKNSLATIDGHDISEVNWKPPCIIYVVVCKEIEQKFHQRFTIRQKSASLSEWISVRMVSSRAKTKSQNANCGLSSLHFFRNSSKSRTHCV